MADSGAASTADLMEAYTEGPSLVSVAVTEEEVEVCDDSHGLSARPLEEIQGLLIEAVEEEKVVEEAKEERQAVPQEEEKQPCQPCSQAMLPVHAMETEETNPALPQYLNEVTHYWIEYVFLGVDCWESGNESDARSRIVVAAHTTAPHHLVWFRITDSHGRAIQQKDITINPGLPTKLTSLDYNGGSAVMGSHLFEGCKSYKGGYRVINVCEGREVEGKALPEGVEVLSAVGFRYSGAPFTGSDAFALLCTDMNVRVLIPGEELIDIVQISGEGTPTVLSVAPGDGTDIIAVNTGAFIWLKDVYCAHFLDVVPIEGKIGFALNVPGHSFSLSSVKSSHVRKNLKAKFDLQQQMGKLSLDLKFDDCFDVRKKEVVLKPPPVVCKLEAVCVEAGGEHVAFATTDAVYIERTGHSGGDRLELSDTIAMHFNNKKLVVIHQSGEMNIFDRNTNPPTTSTARGDTGGIFHGRSPTQWTFEVAGGDILCASPNGAFRTLSLGSSLDPREKRECVVS